MSRSTLAGLGAGVLLGVLALGLARLMAMPEHEEVHYHANWALWIAGERVDLTHDRYMEDVGACQVDPAQMTAESRVHMHDNNHDVIHVHHAGASWGHLLQNLGWGIGAGWIVTNRGEVLRDGDGYRITFILNGMDVPPAHDRVIRPGDRLLLSWGTEDPADLVRERFPLVADNAPEYDEGYDPGGCGGHTPETLGERVRRAFWF